MRFDDSLTTVLAAGTGSDFDAQATWRQLVDLLGRGRIAPDDGAMNRLAALRDLVPQTVRASSARALAFARPPAVLVDFFAQDELAVAAPVLRTATLSGDEWVALLPRLSPGTRSVLRGRVDLPADVVRGLETFGSTDFTLGYDAPAVEPGVVDKPAVFAAVSGDPVALPTPAPSAVVIPIAPLAPSPFVPLGEIARGLPVVAEALRRAEAPASADRFEIADIVARIDAFRRDQPPVARVPAARRTVDRFRLVTDPVGVIRWVEGGGRATLVGVSLARTGLQGLVRVDADITVAIGQRAAVEAGRLEIDGDGELAGSWRLAARPEFDPGNGQLIGYEGFAARPVRHERVERRDAADGLRQLVHELRTPANAVAGFAEFIETELLGPVPPVYRARAATIRALANDLITAIDDLDTAARIEADALDLRPRSVSLTALVRYVAGTLATERGATLVIDGGDGDVVAGVDERSAERLVARLLATVLAAAGADERIGVALSVAGGEAMIAVDRPAAFAGRSMEALFALGDPDGGDGSLLLGTGFTLRLIRNLAREAGGALATSYGQLTLRLPTAVRPDMDRASTS